MLKLYKLFCLTTFIVFAFCVQSASAVTEEFFGIGAELTKDTYNNKIIVIGILNDTPAQKAGLKVGDEITAVDGKKVKKLTIYEVVSLIRGQENTQVKLRIKENFFKRRTVKLMREKITVNICRDKLFESHWMQIANPCYRDGKIMPDDAKKKFSKKFKNTVVALNEYWFKRKQAFQAGFSACMCYSNKNNQEQCLIHLTDRESAKTNTDKAIYKFLREL